MAEMDIYARNIGVSTSGMRERSSDMKRELWDDQKFISDTTLYIIKRIEQPISITKRKISYKLPKKETSC